MNATDPIMELLVDIAVPTASISEIVHIAQLVKAKSPEFDDTVHRASDSTMGRRACRRACCTAG